jgi:serine/threonine protein kinase
MPWRLLVIDGADQGKSFLLPEAGTARVGNNARHCDVHLHDLYVARAHCEVEVEGDRVTVVAADKTRDTLVNGVKVTRQELQPGDVLRVGNSFLCLEAAAEAAPARPDEPEPAAPPAPGEPRKLPELPAGLLGDLVGHTLGHFEVGALLGRGHFGEVFRARDVHKGQDVALKILSPSFPADDGEMKHFARTLKLLAALPHPNLVAPRGAGKTGPYFWIASELVEGESAAAVLRRLAGGKKPKWRRALRVGVHVGRALAAAQRQRLVHGNVTPANILLAAAEGGPVRLNDLVLLRALQGSVLLQEALELKCLAELSYLSPEHLDPDAAVDDLSDQYSLGAVLYALLTGRTPCEGATPEETADRIRTALPEKPKHLNHGIPDELQAAVLRMLAKRPEERYPGPEALLADLERIAAERQEAV